MSIEIAKVFLLLNDELEFFKPCRVNKAVKHIQDAVENDRTTVERRYDEPFNGVLLFLHHHKLELLLKLSPVPVLGTLVLGRQFVMTAIDAYSCNEDLLVVVARIYIKLACL